MNFFKICFFCPRLDEASTERVNLSSFILYTSDFLSQNLIYRIFGTTKLITDGVRSQKLLQRFYLGRNTKIS